MERLFSKATGRIGAAAEVVARRQIAGQVIAGIFAFGLGFWGWLIKAPPHDVNGFLNDVFRTIQLITLHFPNEFDDTLPWQLQIGRLAVPIVAFAATFHVLLGAITRPVRLALLPMAKDHLVFFGATRLTDAAFKRLVAEGHGLVFVQTGLDADRLDALEGSGVTVVTTDPFLPGVMDDLGLARARAAFVATGNDVDNANLAVLAIEIMARGAGDRPAPVIAVEFEDEALADRLAATVDGSARARAVRFHRLSPDRDGAAIELTRHATAIVGDGTTRVHALVVGLAGGWQPVLSRLLVALQVRPDDRPIVTLLLDAPETVAFERWRAARPDLPLVAEIVVLPRGDGLLGDAASRAAWRAATTPIAVALVLRADAEGLATALVLQGDGDDLRTAAAPILVRQSREDRLLATLATGGDGSPRAPIAIGGLLRDESVERLLDPAREKLAIALHAHYLAESRARGWNETAAVAAWTTLPEVLRDANRASAEHLPFLRAALGRPLDGGVPGGAAELAPSDLDRAARLEHRRWTADRIDRGWRYGATRDDAARRHPCLVAWEALDPKEREKDIEMVRFLLSIGDARPEA